jgi:AraC family transcriptional regulator of adaptative response / DNA-3-methyladenine glycosylase II
MLSRIVARTGRQLVAGEDGLTHLFPTPAELADADLDGLGLTKARGYALLAMARAVVDGKLDFQSPVEDVIAALTALPGVGSWTAQYVALRALNEPDAFPTGDLVLRRMAAMGGARLTVRELERLADGWRPWRGYAVMHLWRSASDASRTRSD